MNKKKYNNEWEQKLNPKRFRVTKVKGVPTGWNPFDSDFSRISMSAPFRRLQDKAQVFPLEPNDFVRTIITHSIEVSSVSRSIGVRVENWLLKNGHIRQDKTGHIPSILATAGLAHDIGNPPFGHFGEKCIQDFFKDNGKLLKGLNEKEKADLKNFDGNVQGLRLLLRLGLASDEFSYNLTFPTLATIVKYPKDSITGNQGNKKSISFKKYGFYQTDAKKYKEIDETLGLSNERHPLCFLLEAADDICYSVSDIEDGFKKDTITLEFLLDDLNKKYKDDEECKDLFKKIQKMDKEYKDYENKSSLIAQGCRIFAQTKMIDSAIKRFQDNHEEIINGKFNDELLDYSSSGQLRKFFNDIASNNFNHERVVKRELLGQTVISYLLGKLSNAVLSKDCENTKTSNGKLCSLLSHQSRYAMKKTVYENMAYLKLLMVIDYVASMTDTYALTMYKDLCGVK